MGGFLRLTIGSRLHQRQMTLFRHLKPRTWNLPETPWLAQRGGFTEYIVLTIIGQGMWKDGAIPI